MQISWAGIIINGVMIVAIIIMIVIGVLLKKDLTLCETTESPFCFTIQCPTDSDKEGPCNGYAFRPGPTEGTFYCSSTPDFLVDKNGKQV